MRRRLTPELMDDPAVGREDLGSSLRYIRWVNRRLGGSAALLGHLSRWSKGWPRDRPVTLLDVATGSADIPVAVRRWGLSRGFDIRVTGVELHEATLAFAREHVSAESARDGRIGAGVVLEGGDALRLGDRFKPGSFDYVHAGMFLHHLNEVEALTVLRIMDRLAKRGLVWNDLHRSRLHRLLVEAVLVGMPVIVRHDARVSVEAGFTRREVEEMARRVGVEGARYHRAPGWYRFTLTGERAGVTGGFDG